MHGPGIARPIAFGNRIQCYPSDMAALPLTDRPRCPISALPHDRRRILDWDGDDTDRKFELVDGDPRAMAPASGTHGTMQITIGVSCVLTYGHIDRGAVSSQSRESSARPRFGKCTHSGSCHYQCAE